MTILLKKPYQRNPQEVEPKACFFGNNGYVFLGDVQLGGNRSELVAELRRLADILEPRTVGQRRAYLIAKQMPEAMAAPETAWPFLVDRFPWLFNDIDTNREPYAHHLKAAQAQQDAAAIAHLDNPSQADVAEILFNDRTKTGGSYRRRILKALDATTTTAKNDATPQQPLKKAA